MPGKMMGRVISLVLMILVVNCISACSVDSISDKKVSQVDYTVVADEDLPETLKTAIEEKKSGPFKLSYIDQGEMYIAVGYGEQQSGGYSIVVDDLYMTESNMVIATTLTGPEEEVKGQGTPSYPYLVVKTEYVDCQIIYE